MGFKLSKGDLVGSATSILIGIGKDLLAAVAPEVYAAFAEWNEERKTPDGWSEVEYLTFLYGAIGDVKAKQIGPKWVDYVGDLALGSLQMTVAKHRDSLVAGETPKPAEPPAAPPVDPDRYGKMLYSPPEYDKATESLWWNQATNPIAIRYMLTPKQDEAPYPGWAESN